MVVKASSSYNAILGRPTLNSLRAVTSTYYLKMKFSTEAGLGKCVENRPWPKNATYMN